MPPVINKTTAYIVPANELKWVCYLLLVLADILNNKTLFFSLQMRSQNMELYTASPDAAFMDRDPRNLFALRWDIHTFQFDSGNLVIVPMAGRMVVHFIGKSHESANLYHNQPFDTSNLSHEFLYARFAWAVIKNADAMADRKAFNLESGDADAVAEEVDGGGPSNPASGSKAPAGPEALELAEDMAKAAKAAPFFLEPDGIANPYTYEQMVWYPGYKSVQRRKLEYMNAHPNIRATRTMCIT
ncbi:hypothetical protein M378DRAFT_25012 [Amanita muscaria Koide BX008]|uniref:HNH nuclease domain-containing protein n=1 Tax=Amanita muscaria (strain Koide BX008) TaxID=946122 RepID=A0A0C2WPF9_AMAMK|nr:hypothetical protein M378DRAFT_25012 [Amanita muscaria Koide BX008]